MCGIVIAVTHCRVPARDTVARMLSTQRHRGPEGDRSITIGLAGDREIGLGHNRLSIIDLSPASMQPMRTADGRFTLVFNGVVYNWREIAAQLDRAHAVSAGTGDTATIFAALRQWGPDALQRFNGMWALAMFDAATGQLLLSRDRLGVKPLYAHLDDGDLYIASEVKAILAARDTKFQLNTSAAVTFLSRGLIDVGPESMFEGIMAFPPASYATVDVHFPVRHLEPRRFWHHPVELGRLPGDAGSVRRSEIRHLFVDAVQCSMRADAPAALLLSGGVDSSALAGAMRVSGPRLPAFSMVWSPRESSEERYAEAVARFNGLELVKIETPNPVELLEGLVEATWLNDAPVASVHEVARLRTMEAARDAGFKVMLCGQGADEQLGGYRKFFFFWLHELLRSGRFVAAMQLASAMGWRSSLLRELRVSDAVRYTGAWVTRHSFIAPAVQDQDNFELGHGRSYAHREWADLSRFSLPTLLHSEDRMAAGRSIEMRVPFLDHRLIELFASVHPSEKFRGGFTKAIFREAISDLVPPEVRIRPDKSLLSWPIDQWVRGPFRAHVDAKFIEPMISARLGIIDQRALQVSFARFLGHRGYLSGAHLLRAYALETFLERFADHLALPDSAASISLDSRRRIPPTDDERSVAAGAAAG